MLRRLRHIALVWAALLGLAAASVVSAGQMAPDRAEPTRIAAALVTGFDGEICGIEHDGAHHSCPFCLKLPGPPAARAPDAVRRLVVACPDLTAPDLVRGASPASPYINVRAPPDHG